jgi:hypothetical protein
MRINAGRPAANRRRNVHEHIFAAVVGLDEVPSFWLLNNFTVPVAIVALSQLKGIVILKTDTYRLKRLEHNT